MGFPDRQRLGRARLAVEHLEDRTTPAKLDDALTLALPEFAETGVVGDRINVVMATETNSGADAARLASTSLAEGVTPLGFGIYAVDLAPGANLGEAVAYYGSVPGVLTAAPDTIIQIQQTPNDTYYSVLYGMTKIGAPAAWDTTTGNPNFVVAVIDSGVDYNHSDLAANMWVNPGETAGNGIDDDGNGYVDDIHGWDFANNDNNPFDDNGHGTHVAGTIGAVGNNSLGVVGVNWSVKIMALKFLGANGSGSISSAVAALNYAVNQGVKVSNNSWGGGGFSSTMSTAISRAREAGHIFVAAAGNSGSNNDTTASYPSNYNSDNVVSVAATDSNDALASFSSYGATTVDLAAPGVSIGSTYPNNGYVYMSGTSMAAPHVSGAIALYWSANPTQSYSQVIAKLYSSVDPVAGLAGRVATGGRLNVARMLETTSPPSPPTVAPGPKVTDATFSGTSTQLNNLRVTFDSAINPNSFTAEDISFTGPNGAISTSYTITPVSGSNNTQFDIGFPAQTVGGNYSMSLGPNILDTSGNPMNQDGDALAGEPTQDQYTATGSLVLTVNRTYSTGTIAAPIRDFTTTVSSFTVSEDVTISDLNVRVSLSHTYLRDLVITLTSPAGTTITLFNRRGGSGNNLNATTFDDEASTLIRYGSAPFSGTYRPEQLLSAFDGQSTLGTWTLRVSDVARTDIGTLTNWTLLVTGTLGGGGSGSSAQALGTFDGAIGADTDEAPFVEPIRVAAEPTSNSLAPSLTAVENESRAPSSSMLWLPGESTRRDFDALPVASEIDEDESPAPAAPESPGGTTDAEFTTAIPALYFAPEDSAAGDFEFAE